MGKSSSCFIVATILVSWFHVCDNFLMTYYNIYDRNTSYDSSLGECLNALHSICPDDVVKLTATDFVNVFAVSMQKTRSPELKVNLVY